MRNWIKVAFTLMALSLALIGNVNAIEMEWPAYVKTSPESRSYIRMCPADGGATDAGKGYVYLVMNAESDSLLYTVDWFAGRSEVYLKGEYLVRLWMGRRAATASSTAVSVYKNGVELKSYSKKELDWTGRAIPRWSPPRFLYCGQETCFEFEAGGRVHTITLATGELLSKAKK